jgi:glutaminase
MPEPEVRSRIEGNLDALYQRHLDEEGAVDRFYESGRGYYPPEEAGEERRRFAISLEATDGDRFDVGDSDVRFPLHSISKVFAYALALEDHGRDRVLERVGVEPSGDAFNSIVFDERRHRPHNPMVNAGALATTDLVKGADPEERFDRLLDLMRRYAGNSDLYSDDDVYQAELRTADRNRATAYLMRSQAMMNSDVEETLALYLRQCSVMVTSSDLAAMAATLAHGAVCPHTGDRVMSRRGVRDVLSVMYTCGMYDFAGEWAYQIGVPAKSGVSGGILAVIPGKMGIGVYSPGLDEYGNSVRGIHVCAEISEHLGLHVFATEGEDEMMRGAGGRHEQLRGPRLRGGR